MRPRQDTTASNTGFRIKLWYAALLSLLGVFGVRLFYLQVIRHDHYRTAALSGQLKQYEIPASRGIILAQNGDSTVPLVLNETRYTLFADPKFIKDPRSAAVAVARAIGGNANDYEDKMRLDSRYAVLAKKLTGQQKESVDKLELKGIGTREAEIRTYPQGTLAAQLLGFVNDEGEGKYGLEQALDDDLKGMPGQLKAITDAQGVPLATNKDNIVTEPRPGKRIELTTDLGMQTQLEEILKSGLENARAASGSALIIEPKTGAVKAMANYPTYNPGEFSKVEDGSLFNNNAVSEPIEVGSIMKPLTVAAGLDQRVISKNSTFYDNRFWRIDDAVVRNVEEDGGAGTKSMADLLQLSLNTGATWVLMQMGGGELNEQARTRWHDYMVNHYGFGKPTGIEQGFEGEGSIPSPTDGFGLNITYANTTFGQGMTATPLQMGAAFSSVINGGTYYRPRLVAKVTEGSRESVRGPEVVRKGVVRQDVGDNLRALMEAAFEKNRAVYGMHMPRPEYSIGGKTGTAQIPKPDGGYYDDRYNGTYMGYVGGNAPEYVIVVLVKQPKIAGYAGSKAAGPIFVRLANMLIDNFGVTPKE